MMDKMSCGEKGAKMGLRGTVGRAQNMIDDTLEHLAFSWKALPARMPVWPAAGEEGKGKVRSNLCIDGSPSCHLFKPSHASSLLHCNPLCSTFVQ